MSVFVDRPAFVGWVKGLCALVITIGLAPLSQAASISNAGKAEAVAREAASGR